jgi:SAM-dependent methyltransferase
MSQDYEERLGEYAQRAMGYKTGEFVSLMIHIGDELGLYEVMKGKEKISAKELAEQTGLDERWLVEWLRGQGAAGLIEHLGDEYFRLPDVAVETLLQNDSSNFVGGYFFKPASHEIIEKTVDAFRTGVGVSWGEHGDGASHFLCRANHPFHLMLPDHVIPLIEGMPERLSQGGKVLDVGCGSGHALSVLATAFPNSQFIGVDPAANMVAQATERHSSIPNVDFRVGYGEAITDKDEYDLVTTFDCMHDMTDPNGTMRAVSNALKSDGAWLIKDIRSENTYAENLENPMAALMYGFSVLYCMSSALSQPGGAGLGTLGFPPAVCKSMGEDAGFTQFKVLDFEQDPFNYFYELRL